MKLSINIVILFCLFFSNELVAQVKKIGIPDIEYFNRRTYHGATQNWGITQGKSGFLYFGNNNGVLEFDGDQWRLYRDLGELNVRSTHAVGDRIYAGAFNELGYFYYDSASKLKYKSLLQGPNVRNFEDFWHIYDWNGYVVFHSQKGLCFYKDDQLTHIIYPESRFVSAFVVNGLFLVQDEQAGLMEVRGNDIYPINGGKLFAGKEIKSIMSLSNSEMIIGTMNNGLYRWDMQMFAEWKVPANNLLKKINIFCGCKYSDDRLVYGTIQGGIVIIDDKGEVYLQIDKDRGLRNNTVLSAFVDREGNIWGGLDNGIVKVNFNSTISFLQGYYNLGTGYVMEKFKNEYYFGTNQAVFKIGEQKFKDPLKDRNDFIKVINTGGQVWSLYHDERSLLCGHNLGVFEIKDSGANEITPADVNGVWNFKTVKANDNLLLSGTYTGLIVLEYKSGKWQYRNTIKNFNESARFIEWDNEGYLWMSHGYRGVFRIKLNDEITEATEVLIFKNTEFPNNHNPLTLTKINGKCLFSSKDGIYQYDYTAGKFVHNDDFEAMFSNGIYPNDIKEDQYRNLWCFYGDKIGVLRFLEDGTYKDIWYPFLPLDRKMVSAFEYVYVEDEKNVFFGVEDGFAHYATEDYKNYKIPFKVHLRSFKGNSDSTTYQLNYVGDSIKQNVVPSFTFRKNTFNISFVASFYEQRNVLYSTWLRNYDSGFGEWTEENHRSYSNLTEGEYEIIIKAKNQYGVQAPPVSFKFIVLPPWYRSVVAKVVWVILFLMLVALIYYFISKRIEFSRQKEKSKQQERFRIKEEELKTAALVSEKEMIRLRNDKLRNEMVFKEKELANSTVHIIQKNDLLSDIKEQLKKIVRIQEKSELEKKVRLLIKKIDRDIDTENNWQVFETHFGQVHEAFFNSLKEKHPDLTSREQKLCAYIKMGMASKDIASLMNITTRAVENNRYKLRQKLGLSQGDNLLEYIENV